MMLYDQATRFTVDAKKVRVFLMKAGSDSKCIRTAKIHNNLILNMVMSSGHTMCVTVRALTDEG